MIKRCFLVLPTLLALTAVPAQAQVEEVSPAPDSAQWVTFVLAIMLSLLVAMISFWSSRRGHQD